MIRRDLIGILVMMVLVPVATVVQAQQRDCSGLALSAQMTAAVFNFQTTLLSGGDLASAFDRLAEEIAAARADCVKKPEISQTVISISGDAGAGTISLPRLENGIYTVTAETSRLMAASLGASSIPGCVLSTDEMLFGVGMVAGISYTLTANNCTLELSYNAFADWTLTLTKQR